MKKIGVLILIFLVILIAGIVSAASNQTVDEKAYNCLKGKVQDKCKNLNFEEQAFSIMALSDNSAIQSECKKSLLDKSSKDECWPSSSCKIKDTALALLALNNINQNTDKIKRWLLNSNKTPTELEWYLEIDASKAAQCEIKYDSIKKTVNIAENKKLSGSLGDCLELAYDNYFLKISSSCLKKTFEVSCNQNFVSTILYKKTASNIWYISSKAESASSGGKTTHKISSLCFGTSGCDYEGSLWAVLALQKAGKDVSAYLSYLSALSEDNTKFFPSVFLHISQESSSSEYLQEILAEQNDNHWDVSGNRYYDTALALLALSETDKANAKSWLAENQETSGCWNSNNVRDTAFLLWAGWPKTPYTDTGTDNCEPTYYCITNNECIDVSGNKLDNFYCPGLEVCCNKPAVQKTCQQQGGKICASGETCSIGETSSSDNAKCCLGSCKSGTTLSECEQAGNQCRASCLSTEEAITDSCNDAGDSCCQETGGGGGSYWWIWLLVILIILVVLGIIFRNRLRVFLFKMKGGFKSSGVTSSRPPFSPPSSGFRMMPRTALRPVRPMPAARQVPIRPATLQAKSKADKELDETLRKLREMSK